MRTTTRMFIRLGIAGLLIACVSTVAPTAESAWPAGAEIAGLRPCENSGRLDNSEFAGWSLYRSDVLSSPVLAIGHPVPVSGDLNAALCLIKAAVGIRSQFAAVHRRDIRGLQRGYWGELRDGLPVLCGRADVTLNSRGEIMRWGLRVHDGWPTRDSHLLDIGTAAAQLAMKSVMPKAELVSDQSFAAWYPDIEGRVLRPVYWIRIAGVLPHERWEGLVDAVSGEVILDWPGIQTDVISGTVQGPYRQPFDFSDIQIGTHAFETVTINGSDVITDVNGHFSAEAGSSANLETELRGPYVWAQNDDGDDGLMTMSVNTPFQPITWEWTTDDAVEPELNLFHHTTLIHEWYRVLDPAFTALDYPLPAVANYGHAYDNAFWNGHGTYYGDGAQYHNFGMFSDVIYHEYTHGVTDGIYPDGMLPYTDEPGALNEAWSDYFASAINGDPYMAEWIGGTFGSWFRNLENDLVYPIDWSGEVHYDSRFISAALWEIRAALGEGVANPLAHFARYELAETFFDYLVAVLETDDDDGDLSNGTPNSGVIYGAFGRHGIGPNNLPNFVLSNLSYYADGTGGSVGDDDRFFEAGETIELTMTVTNDVTLFPPPAEGVQITISANDASLSIENGIQQVGSLGPNQSYSLIPVLIHVSGSAPDHWATLDIHVTCTSSSVQLQDSIAFTIGTPRILIVQDDPTSDVERFVGKALRGQDRIYDNVQVDEGATMDAALFPRPGLVIWLSGNAAGNILNANDQANLQAYLDAGNRVILSGQNIADNLEGTAFLQYTLQTQIELDSLLSYAVTASRPPLEPADWFLLSGSGGASNQVEETSFLPYDVNNGIAYYGRGSSGYTAAIQFAAGHGLLFGFGLEAVSGMGAGSTSLTELMNQIYGWAGDVLPIEENVPPGATLPTEWKIVNAYPNPFNSRTTIEYSIPMFSAGQLAVFDITGRLVEQIKLVAGGNRISWSPRVSSGVYFARIQWDGGQTKPVKLLLVR